MYLKNSPASYTGGKGDFRMESVLAPRFNDAPASPTIAVTGTLPYHSAWRVLQVAEKPGDLLESNVLNDLNPPTRIADTSWIHPGKSAWTWWNGKYRARRQALQFDRNHEVLCRFRRQV